MERTQPLTYRAALAALAVALASGSAWAGGFALHERSAAAQGTSFASADSGGDDVTFAGFNPASIGNVENFEIGASFSGILVDNSGRTANPFVGGATTSADPGTLGFVPALAAGYRLSEQFAIGLTVNSGFGLQTDYPNNALKWPWAAAGLETELVTITTTPVIAWSPTPKLTIAAGPQIHYLDATLTSAVGAPGTLGTVFPRWPEGKLTGDAFEFGWQAGALFRPWDGGTIGVSYAAGYDVDIDGKFKSPLPLPTPDATARTSIPDVFGVGFRQEITDSFRAMAEFQYYNWSAFDEIGIMIDFIGDATEITNYDDAIFVAVGAEYDVSDALTIRGGVAYDETPTNNTFRSVRVPDADRFWVSVGAGYNVTENFRIDGAYSLLIADNTTVTAGVGAPVRYNDGLVHIFTVGGSLKF